MDFFKNDDTKSVICGDFDNLYVLNPLKRTDPSQEMVFSLGGIGSTQAIEYLSPGHIVIAREGVRFINLNDFKFDTTPREVSKVVKTFDTKSYVWNLTTLDSPSGLVAASTVRGHVSIFHMERGEVFEHEKVGRGGIRGMTRLVSSDNKFVTTSTGGHIDLMDYRIFQHIRTRICSDRTRDNPNSKFYGCTEDPTTSSLFTCDNNNKRVLMFDIRNLRHSKSSNRYVQHALDCIFVKSISMLWLCDIGGRIIVYDPRKLSERYHVLKPHTKSIYRLRMINGGRYVASCGSDKTVKIYNPAFVYDKKNGVVIDIPVRHGCVYDLKCLEDASNHIPQQNRLLIEREEKERIDFIFESSGTGMSQEEDDKYCIDQDEKVNMLFPFRDDRVLRIWKSMLIDSTTIPNLETNRSCDIFTNMNLQVKEEVINSILLGKMQKEEVENVTDYYLFFKKLGLKREMWEMIKIMESKSSNSTFGQLFDIFGPFATKYESENIKSWFSFNPHRFQPGEIKFEHAISFWLFLRMKDLVASVDHSSAVMLKPGINCILFHISQPIQQEEYQIFRTEKHEDFVGVNWNQIRELKYRFGKLLKTGKYSNLDVIISGGRRRENNEEEEGEEEEEERVVKVHREILIWKTNFFYKMLHFKGREYHEFVNNGIIRLSDFRNSQDFERYLELVYLGEFRTSSGPGGDEEVCVTNVDLRCLFFLAIHLEKFQEWGMIPKFLKEFQRILDRKSKEEVVMEILEHGYYLYDNDMIQKLLIPVLGNKGIKMTKILRMIDNSYRDRKYKKKAMELEDELERKKEEIDLLTKKLKLYEEKFGSVNFDGVEKKKKLKKKVEEEEEEEEGED